MAGLIQTGYTYQDLKTWAYSGQVLLDNIIFSDEYVLEFTWNNV